MNEKQKKKIKSLIITQIILLCVFLLITILKPHKTYEYTGPDLIDNSTPYMSFHPGSYRIDIDYDTQVAIANEENAKWHILIGNILYYPPGLRGWLEGQVYSDNDKMEIPFWLYRNTKELWIKFDAPDMIRSVRITETNAFYYEIALFLVLAFGLIDFILFRVIKSVSGDKEEIKKNQVAGIIVVTALVFSLPFMLNYLSPGHDISFHLNRIEGVKQGLLDGKFPLRINRFSAEGRGYADPIFYPQLFLIFPAFLRVLGISMARSYKYFILAMNFTSCIISYLSFKGISRKRKPALIGMIIYNLAPYHISLVYCRSAIGEALAYMFFPLVVYGGYLLLTKENDIRSLKKGTIITTVALSCLLQSHILSCEMIAIFSFLIIVIYAKRFFRPKTLLAFMTVVLLTIGMNLWFIIPFLQSMRLDLRAFHMDNDLAVKGLTLYQVIGARGRLYGATNYLLETIYNEIGVSLGISIPVGVMFCLFKIRDALKNRKTDIGFFGITSFLLGALGLWMCTHFFPWVALTSIPKLGIILEAVQYPWRYMGLSTLFFSVAVVCVLTLEENESQLISNKMIIVVMAITAGMFAIYNFDVFTTENTVFYDPYDEKEISDSLVLEEYLYVGNNINTVTESGEVYSRYYHDKDSLIVDVENDNGENNEIVVPIVYYPYYRAITIDKSIAFSMGRRSSGLAYITIPKGYSGQVKVYAPEKKLWILGDIISLLTMGLFIASSISDSIRIKKENNKNV